MGNRGRLAAVLGIFLVLASAAAITVDFAPNASNGNHPRKFERVATRATTSNGAMITSPPSTSRLGEVTDLAMCMGDLWEVDPVTGTVIGVDPTTGGVQQVIRETTEGVPRPARLTCVGTQLWVAGDGPFIAVFNATSGQLLGKFRLPGFGLTAIGGLLAVGNTVWATDKLGGGIDVVNATTFVAAKVTNQVQALRGPGRMVSDGSTVWVAGSLSGSFGSIISADVTSATVKAVNSNPYNAPIPLTTDPLADPSDIALSSGGIWVSNFDTSSVSEFSSSSGVLLGVIPQATGHFDEPSSILASPTQVWVANANSNNLIELDSTSRSVLNTYMIPSSSPLLIDAMVQAGTQLYAASFTTGEVYDVDTASGLIRELGTEAAVVSPVALSSDARHTWVVNGTSDTVVGINSSTGFQDVTLDLRGVAQGALTGITDDGRHLWVTVSRSGQVIEATTSGVVVHVISGLTLSSSAEAFSDGVHVWVSEPDMNSVVELNVASGTIVQVLSGNEFKFSTPRSIVCDGVHVWIANLGTGTITELSETTGHAIRVLSGLGVGFGQPMALTLDGSNVWVAGSGGAYVSSSQAYSNASFVELASSTGVVVKRIALAGSSGSMPVSMAAVRGHLWICDLMQQSVAEYKSSSGALLGTFNRTSTGLVAPIAVVSDGVHVWMGDPEDSHVTETLG